MIARPSLRGALAAVALAALVLPASAPFAGTMGWAQRAAAAEPAAIPPAPTVIWHGSRADRVVALTFDDGWSAANLRRIYRILVRERVPATFFVTGVYVQRAPALWRRIAEAGFPLANHSYLHRDTRRLTPRLEALDLALTRQVVEQATGRAMLPYYRPPYGARNPATDRRAAAAGFPYVVLWDTTGADTTRHVTVAQVVRDATAGRAGSIVLLHAGPGVTPRALPAIIALYRARGFTFVTLPELLGTPPADLGAPAVGPVLAASTGSPSRSVDRPGEKGGGRQAAGAAGQAAGAAPPNPASPDPSRVGPPTVTRGAGGHAAGPPAAAGPPPPARAAPSASADAPPPARDAAWVRRGGTSATIAAFTVILLGILLAGAAAAGRRRPPEDHGVL